MSADSKESSIGLALVTGGAKRLGREILLGLVKKGYAAGIHYHHSAREAVQLADELEGEGVPVVLLPADLQSPTAIKKLFKKIDDSGFPLKILVNSAAQMERKPLNKISIREWDELFALNLRAAWYCSMLAAERMTDGGVIINISDTGAQRAWSSFGAYTVSKAALNSLTMVLAQTLAPSIRVNAVAPGLVFPAEGMSEETWNRLVHETPLNRPVESSAVMDAISLLLENTYITGEIINVDGGRQLV
jgi:NAD(P)-dependent dehydrogenase (short-subunit alcohol dehydrogenase family)